MISTIASTPEDSHQDLALPESGWELHVGRGSHLRPALEVHTGDGLIDIAVAGGLDTPLLRGAVRGRGPSRWALAWGHLPPGAGSVVVEFQGRHGPRLVPAAQIAGAFWAAEAPGDFRSVTATVTPAEDGPAGGPPAGAERADARLHRYRP
jgi:hypothetical protein